MMIPSVTKKVLAWSAAAVAVVLIVVTGTIVVVVEAQEQEQAKTFNKTLGLSARGRSEAGIKKYVADATSASSSTGASTSTTTTPCEGRTEGFSTIKKKKDQQIDSLLKEIDELKKEKEKYQYGPKHEDEIDVFVSYDDHRALKDAKKTIKKSVKKDVPQLVPPVPIPPDVLEVKCFPENTLRPFDFSGPDVSYALNPGAGEPNMPDNEINTGYLNWSFNRGMSAITIGSYSSAPDSDPVPATVFTVIGQGQGGPSGNMDGFSVAAARYNKDESDKRGGLGIKFNTEAKQNQNTQLGTVTTVTFIPPYKFDLKTQSYQPDTVNLKVIYFLVGVTSGDVYLCFIEPFANIKTDATCESNPFASLGGASNGITGNISEVLYIPQINAVVIMTFVGGLYSYSISFSSLGTPTLTPQSTMIDFQNQNPGNDYGDPEDGDVAAVVLPRSLAAVYVDETTTYLYVAGLYFPAENKYGYGLSPSPLTIFSIDGTDTTLPIRLKGALLNTFLTYQVVPVPTGIYFLAGGNGVFYVKYQGQDAPNGMLGIEPQIYQAFGPSSDGGANEDYLPATVTSISFSANPLNVVVYRDPSDGKDKNAFEGGALFVSFITMCGLYEGRTIDNYQAYYPNNGCVGSISMVNTCTGVLSEFVVDNVQGPVYTSIADINMNLLVQNGQGGLSTYSVPYTPGLVQDVEWLQNQYYVNSCDCTKEKGLFLDILAGVALVLAIIALPELLPDVVVTAAAYAGVAVATVGCLICISSSLV